jgi:hypothetical protein
MMFDARRARWAKTQGGVSTNALRSSTDASASERVTSYYVFNTLVTCVSLPHQYAVSLSEH